MSKRVSSSSAKAASKHANKQTTLKLKSSDIMSDNDAGESEVDDVHTEAEARAKKRAKTEEESMLCTETLPPEVAKPVVVAASASAEPTVFEELPDGEEADQEGYNIMTKISSEVARLYPKLHKSKVLVRNPDLAMILWCKYNKKGISWFDYNTREQAAKSIKFVWQQEDKGKGKKEFTNVKAKRLDQMFVPKIRAPLINFCVVSPAACASFLKHGNTKENGVNGNEGADMGKGVIVQANQIRYTFDLNNEAYSSLIKDKDNMNPVMQSFLDGSIQFEKAVLAAAFNTTGAKKAKCMQELEDMWAAQAEKDPNFVIPKTVEDKVERTCATLFKTKIKASTADKSDSGRCISMGASAFRTLYKDWQTKEEENPEAEGYIAPSTLFELCNFNQAKPPRRQIHNNIPMFACRRAQDVVEGVEYEAPFFLVPKENAELDFRRDVVFVLHSKGFYPWKLDKPGCTNTPLAYIWLNTKQALKNMTRDEIVACDPLKAIPMAGVYEGPLDRQKKMEVHAVQTGNGVDFMSHA